MTFIAKMTRTLEILIKRITGYNSTGINCFQGTTSAKYRKVNKVGGFFLFFICLDIGCHMLCVCGNIILFWLSLAVLIVSHLAQLTGGRL